MSEMLSKLGDYALDRVHGSPLSRIINHLMGGQPGASGLNALLDKLRNGGLGAKVDSWVSNGPNEPVEPAELEKAIGPQEVDRLASDSGVDRGGLMGTLSQFLPRMVDGLTPQGRAPSKDEALPGDDRRGIDGILGGLLGALQQRGTGAAGGGGLDDMLGGLLNRLGGGDTAPARSADAPVGEPNRPNTGR